MGMISKTTTEDKAYKALKLICIKEFSPKTQISIIEDFLEKEHDEAFIEGQKELINDMFLVTKNKQAKAILKTIIKKATSRS